MPKSKKTVKVEDLRVCRDCEVFIIQNKDRQIVGKIIAAYPSSSGGAMYVNVWDWSDRDRVATEMQTGTANGGGYDLLTAALSGINFAGITLDDYLTSWQKQLEKHGYDVTQVL